MIGYITLSVDLSNLLKNNDVGKDFFNKQINGILYSTTTDINQGKGEIKTKEISQNKYREQKMEVIEPTIDCYKRSKIQNLSELFEDIIHSSIKSNKDNNIFFVETSCSKNGLLHLTARQACAIESAAIMNPNSRIYLLTLSPVGLQNKIEPIIEAIQSYRNIFFRNVNLWKFAEGSPAEKWIQTNKIFHSNYLINHLADFLRYLTLWKYGGTYLDMDIILLRTLEDILPNFTGAESEEYLAIGAMNFASDGVGHEIVENCVNNFQENFDGSQWSFNGNGVLTRVMQDFCNVIVASQMTAENCNGFRVYLKNAFYAIEYMRWKLFFDENEFENAMNLTKDSILIHVWNKMSKNEKIKVGSKVAYGIYAKKYCPKVYNSCGKYF